MYKKTFVVQFYIIFVKKVVYSSVSKFGVRFKDFFNVFEKVSSAHQDCIYLIKKYSKNTNIVKYYYDLKYLFSIVYRI